VKITAGGYTLAALTEGGDLYCWGGRPSQQPLFEGLSNMPIPVDVADGDVKDVALGERHIIVLTVDGHVLVRGSNKSGQLGLGQDGPPWVEDWKRVENVPQDTNWDIERVAAGSKTSFIITHKVGGR
jgi:alpha-tubulin suppressor-like RCC1 family protein